MQVRYTFAVSALAALCGAPVMAADLTASIEIPRLNTSEYHRPYVAAWIERADNTVATTLTVWYDVRNKGGAEGAGTKWLKDMRQWWRRTGRELEMPVDGVSSATRPAGKHQLAFTEGAGSLPKLPAGSYKFVVEAAREQGGREVITIPFQWPPAKADQQVAQGNGELGEVKLDTKP